MKTEKRDYEAPVLFDQGEMVPATRLKSVYPVEPGGMGLQGSVGDLGFGL